MKNKASVGRLILGAFAAAFVAAALFGTAASAQAKPYYEGKTITIIVGFSPGGGSDLGARAIANYLGEHIDGHPTVIVENMPGAGSIKAANFVYERAPKDGTTVLFGAWFLASQRMGMVGMRVKYDKLTLVAPTRSPGGFVTYMRTDAVPGGYHGPKDIFRTKNLRIAGVAPTASVDRRLTLSFKTLGIPIIHVFGYKGLAAAGHSVRTGESQATVVALNGYEKSVVPNLVKPGLAVPLFYWSLEDDSGKPIPNEYMPKGIPSFYEFYQQAAGHAPSGKYWEALRTVNDIAEVATHIFFGPPGMNSEATKALRAGVIATLKDPRYITQAKKIATYPQIYVPVEKVEALVPRVMNASPEFFKVLEEITNPQNMSKK